MIKKDYNICPITKFVTWLIVGLIVCFIGINKTFAVTPDLSNHEFRGLGVNNGLLNCSAQGTNCGWNSYDMEIYTLGTTKNYNVTQYPIVPTGFTFNMYNGGVFVDGYVYTLNVVIRDNTSSLEYYRQWSYSFTSGYDNFTNTNEYAQILNTTITKAGYNVTISIDFIAKDWFRYLRLNARAPFNDGKTYPDITYLQQDIVYYSLMMSGTFTYGINNYTLSVMPYYEYQNYIQNQTIINGQNEINDSINDDDVDSSSWSNFFNNFTTNTFGLTSIITAPLNLIQSLTSTSCTDLQLPLPYLQNKYLTLPCMTTIYSQYFGNFFTLYQTITYGIIAYWVCVRIFNLVKDFKNPDHDEIEVVDL